MKIYHNPRCSKSREGLKILENSKLSFEIIDYIKQPLTEQELSALIQLLKIKPMALIRKNEAVWKEHFKNKSLTDGQLIKAMVDYPKLIERPIVTKGTKAVIGRPVENIKHLLTEN